MQTITLQRQDTAENMLGLASILGYTTEIQDGEKEVDVMDGEEKVGTELVPNMIENINTPLAHVAEYYQAMIDTDIKTKVLASEKSKLAVQRAAEDKAIEDGVSTQVGSSTIITE